MIKRSHLLLKSDPRRVLIQFFFPGSEKRAAGVINRILNLSEGEVDDALQKVINNYSDRHKNFEASLMKHFQKVEHLLPHVYSLSESRKLLIGSYFSKEYSIESAALFNPSMIPHPDQSGLMNGELRFIMSLRATGEGHISSIEFRSGIIDTKNNIHLDKPSSYITMASSREEKVIKDAEMKDANYNISFSGKELIDERVIFPYSRSEQNGIEDVRFVQFTNDDGSKTYYGTFTAYDGHKILSELIQTDNFIDFKIRTLSGENVKDKGMALFPKKINGKYTIISRLDGENLYYMQSENIYEWQTAHILREPVLDWEFIQIGNCGSPVETEKGWILLTHGVGTGPDLRNISTPPG